MPEAFVKDPNVPARWRILAIINGFFLNGQKCWAGNDYLAEKIGTHKDTVSQAVKELEDLKMIVCERTRRTRLIVPVLVEIGVDAYLRQATAPISDRRQRLSISVSNSESKDENAASHVFASKAPEDKPAEDYTVAPTDEEGNEQVSREKKPKREGKNKIALRINRKFSDMCFDYLSTRPVDHIKGYMAALFSISSGGLTEGQVYDLLEEWFNYDKSVEERARITAALSAANITKFRAAHQIV